MGQLAQRKANQAIDSDAEAVDVGPRKQEESEVESEGENLMTSLLDDLERGTERHTPRGYIQRRYILVFMLFWGLFVIYSLRVCISVAAAPSSKAAKLLHAANQTTVAGISMYTEFGWTHTKQGIVLGAFFNGYITSQIIGGVLARRLGGTPVLGLSVLLASLATLATPYVAPQFESLVACRMILGAAEGASFPTVMTLLGHWCTPDERASMVGMVMSGVMAGNVATLPLSGWILATFGWRMIFYVFAAIGIFWSIIFVLVTTSTPAYNSSIHPAEKHKILSSLPSQEGANKIPWLRIFSSSASWALFVSHTSFNWAFYTLLTELPSYLALSLDFDSKDAGFISSVPYLCMFSTTFVAGFLADWVFNKGFLSRTNVRKVFMIGALMIPAACLVLCGYATNWQQAVVLMVLSIGFSGFSHAGFSANYLEVSCTLSGMLMALGNTFGTLPGIISPVLTGMIVDSYGCVEGNPAECQMAYRTVFWIAFAVYTFGSVFYGLFATSERVLP